MHDALLKFGLGSIDDIQLLLVDPDR